MRYNKTIELRKQTTPLDEYGNPQTDKNGNQVKELSSRKVYANKNSIGASEYYNSASHGLRPEVKFEIRSVEYDDEKEIKYPPTEEGDIYNIIRVQNIGEKTLLTCEKVNSDA